MRDVVENEEIGVNLLPEMSLGHPEGMPHGYLDSCV